MRDAITATTSKPGRSLSRLWWRIRTWRRPRAGRVITILRGSPTKGSGDYSRGSGRGERP